MSYSGSYRFQRYDVNTTIKNLRFFGFNGGMVTQIHPEKLGDGQHVLIENGDVVAGGTVINRAAYSQVNNPSSSISGATQGRWKYQNTAGGQDIVAINGHLYTVSGNTYTLLTITGLASFQTTRPINAVQYRDKMYFATGSAIVMYDGTTASAITAYAPNGLEALYIGTNGYAVNPDTYLVDTTGASDTILGLTASARYGLMNTAITFTAYVSKISVDTLEYQFETKSVSDATYPATVDQAFSTTKTFVKSFNAKDDYMVRCSIRKQGTTTVLSQYILPKYVVNSTPDTNPEKTINFTNMSTCNMIFVHYDRLCVYGDTSNPDYLYISHLNNFTYFPRTNIMPIIDPLRGALQSAIQFKNFLVLFTDGSIQQLTGTSPKDFALQPIHTSLGTVKPYSVRVMQNYVVFVGNDNGVYVLKTFNFAGANDKMNVQRIDNDIKDKLVSDISTSTRILSAIYNNQYYLYVQTASNNYVYRYYYDMNIWVRDSLGIQFITMDTIGNAITTTSPTGGTIYQMKRGVYFDGTNSVFNIHLISKDYDMNMPHHRKKMKQFQFLCELTALSTASVKVYGDNVLLTTQSITHDPNQTSDADKLKVTTSGRFRYTKVDITLPVVEETVILGYAYIFKLNTPK